MTLESNPTIKEIGHEEAIHRRTDQAMADEKRLLTMRPLPASEVVPQNLYSEGVREGNPAQHPAPDALCFEQVQPQNSAKHYLAPGV